MELKKRKTNCPIIEAPAYAYAKAAEMVILRDVENEKQLYCGQYWNHEISLLEFETKCRNAMNNAWCKINDVRRRAYYSHSSSSKSLGVGR